MGTVDGKWDRGPLPEEEACVEGKCVLLMVVVIPKCRRRSEDRALFRSKILFNN